MTPIPTPPPAPVKFILVRATGELWLLDVFDPGGLDGELLSETELGVDECDVAADLSEVRPLFKEPWRLKLPDPICELIGKGAGVFGEFVPLSTGDPTLGPMAPSDDRDELDERSLDLLRTESKFV